MLAQHYKIPASTEHLTKAKPGQVILNEDSDDIIGFIDFVSDCEVAMMLFQPMEIEVHPNITIIAEECDAKSRFREIVKDDVEIAELWEEIFKLDDYAELQTTALA